MSVRARLPGSSPMQASSASDSADRMAWGSCIRRGTSAPAGDEVGVGSGVAMGARVGEGAGVSGGTGVAVDVGVGVGAGVRVGEGVGAAADAAVGSEVGSAGGCSAWSPPQATAMSTAVSKANVMESLIRVSLYSGKSTSLPLHRQLRAEGTICGMWPDEGV